MSECSEVSAGDYLHHSCVTRRVIGPTIVTPNVIGCYRSVGVNDTVSSLTLCEMKVIFEIFGGLVEFTA